MSSANTPFDPTDLPPNASSSSSPTPLLPCDDVAALVPAHSIGATDPEEVAVVQQRLSSCATAAADLAAYSKLAEALLYTTPPQPAPARVADALRAASSPSAMPPRAAAPVGSRPPAKRRKKISPFTLLPAPPPPPTRQWSWGRSLAVAASLLLVGFNLTLLVENRQLHARQEELATALDRQNRALIFLAAEEPQEVVLPAVQENSQAQADVLWNNSLGIAVVYVRSFPESSPDQAYQLWLRKGEQRTSAGVFTVDASGMGILVFPIEESLEAYDAMGITQEPAGGSPGPTGPAVVRGSL